MDNTKLLYKLGDKFYTIDNNMIKEHIIKNISLDSYIEYSNSSSIADFNRIIFTNNDVGTKIFLTKEEAESKLDKNNIYVTDFIDIEIITSLGVKTINWDEDCVVLEKNEFNLSLLKDIQILKDKYSK